MKTKILIVGVNWLGDSIMSMPAIEVLKKENPDFEIAIAAKEKLVDLWKLFPCCAEVLAIEEGGGGTLETSKAIRAHSFDRAYVFPNSFRSALLPFMASVPRRIGMAGHARKAMLNEVTLPLSEDAGMRHQAWEYADILGVKPDAFPFLPALTIPDQAREKADALLRGQKGMRLALIPGAAFGDAKRWPAEHFCEVGARAARELGVSVIVLGAPSEAAICRQIADEIGPSAISVAGKTDLAAMAALLQRCEAAVSNDCGGMHVAAAMGVKIVAVFGVTDPEKTGPLGEGHRIVRATGCEGARDISREARKVARERLASIDPERVFNELQSIILHLDGKA